MTAADYLDAAVVELKRTWSGYTSFGANPPPPGSHWANALVLLAQVRTELGGQPAPPPPPLPPPPPPGNVGPSGIPMPTSPPAGWRRVLDDDFADWTCPLGSFPTSQAAHPLTSNGKWSDYPNWGPIGGGTPHSMYDAARVVSVHDHVLDQWFHSETIGGALKFLSAAIQPRVNGHELYSYGMRVSVCWRVPVPFGSYKASWLLWPQSETWPRDGEIDFPECPYSGHVGGFMHRQNATRPDDQEAWSTAAPVGTAWHVSTFEWQPGHLQFVDNFAGHGPVWTARVPATPMRYVIQSECYSELHPTDQGHVLIDWVTIDLPA